MQSHENRVPGSTKISRRRDNSTRMCQSVRSLRHVALSALFVSGLCVVPQVARSQTNFYAGKTVTIVVGASAGGGYDIYARAIAPFLGAHIPGNPKVIVQNMPGAGGLTSVLYLDATAPKDGTVITTFNSGVLTDAFTSGGAAKVDFKTMAWIGSANKSFRFCYFWNGSGFKTWDDLSGSKQATMGAIGVNSGAYNDIAVLKNLMKKNVRPVLGYPGRSEVHLGIERGELDGECGPKEGMPDSWFTENKINIVASLSEGKSDDIPDGVPWMGDFLKDPQDVEVLRLLTAATQLGRPYVASRQVPRERIEILQKAFAAAVNDKDFLAQAKKRKMDISLVTGPQAQELVTKVLDAPKAVSDEAKAIIK
jgi:tripartite-type tricarboxylate transporter receptor subunit TctC